MVCLSLLCGRGRTGPALSCKADVCLRNGRGPGMPGPYMGGSFLFRRLSGGVPCGGGSVRGGLGQGGVGVVL